jgi:hypothetical protein
MGAFFSSGRHDRQIASSSIGKSPGEDRRYSPRVRVLKKGKLILPNHSSVLDCVIRDVSGTGARLSCESAGLLPGELELVFHAVREVRQVEVVWRRHDELGVKFLSPPRLALNLHV